MIVVATDGSPASRQSIGHGAALARALGSELRILRVIDPQDAARGQRAAWPRRLEASIAVAEEDLRRMAAAEAVDAAPAVGVLLKGESTAAAVLRVADELAAEMIVMSSRSHGAIHHALGSVAMGVLGGASVPVMMTGPHIESPLATADYHVLATSDGSEASESIFTALKPFLIRTRLSLLTVYVPLLADRGEDVEVEACYEHLWDLQRRLLPQAQAQVIVRRARDWTQPESIVVETARDIGANAIAMSTQGHSAAHHVLLGSFAAIVLGRSSLPVILARRPPASA